MARNGPAIIREGLIIYKVYANLIGVKSKIKMANQKSKTTKNIELFSRGGSLALIGLVVVSLIAASFSLVSADQYEAKIQALSHTNNGLTSTRNQLGSEAANLSEVIAKLQAQINAKQAQIAAHQKEVNRLKREIRKAEIELERQRGFLGETIKSMYLDGDITTVEMLASSKNLSDFFDKQQYRESVRTKLKNTLDKITQLKLNLNTRKQKIEKLIAEQKMLKNDLLGQQAEKHHLLSLNQGQQSELNAQLRSNNAKIAELRRQQAAANARLFGGTGVVYRGSCGGGYPADAVNLAGGHWGCNYPQDNNPDNWGMYNRECVSYTAWKVYQSGRHMPYWGGRGNAAQWDDNARAEGIPVDDNPRPGDVAISNSGYYGHAMYVESVNAPIVKFVRQTLLLNRLFFAKF